MHTKSIASQAGDLGTGLNTSHSLYPCTLAEKVSVTFHQLKCYWIKLTQNFFKVMNPEKCLQLLIIK